MKRVLAGAVAAGAVALVSTAWAEGPMTPMRPLTGSPAGSPAARQWVEPPPAAQPAEPQSSKPAVAATEPESQAAPTEPAKRPRSTRRTASASRGTPADRLNRRQVMRARYGGYSYYGSSYGGYGYGFGPSPNGGRVD